MDSTTVAQSNTYPQDRPPLLPALEREQARKRRVLEALCERLHRDEGLKLWPNGFWITEEVGADGRYSYAINCELRVVGAVMILARRVYERAGKPVFENRWLVIWVGTDWDDSPVCTSFREAVAIAFGIRPAGQDGGA